MAEKSAKPYKQHRFRSSIFDVLYVSPYSWSILIRTVSKLGAVNAIGKLALNYYYLNNKKHFGLDTWLLPGGLIPMPIVRLLHKIGILTHSRAISFRLEWQAK